MFSTTKMNAAVLNEIVQSAQLKWLMELVVQIINGHYKNIYTIFSHGLMTFELHEYQF